MILAANIGLELHCQLTALQSKLFCSCYSDYRDKTPNKNVCQICSIVQHLGVCDTKLEGSVRCDANVSIGSKRKVEIKNVNSFKEVEKALSYEITRQNTMSLHDIEIKAETRHWDDLRKITKQARTKEEEQDYRYFPEPDIPTIILGNEFVSSLKAIMPELPDERKIRFVTDYELSEHMAQVLIDNKEVSDFFELAVSIYSSPKEIANSIITDLMAFIDDSEQKASILSGLKIEPKHVADLVKLVDQNTINRNTAKMILKQIIKTGEMPSQLVTKTNASKIDDTGAIAEAVESIFTREKSAVIDAKNNPNVANFLLGKVMQLTRGRADPKIALNLITRKLTESN